MKPATNGNRVRLVNSSPAIASAFVEVSARHQDLIRDLNCLRDHLQKLEHDPRLGVRALAATMSAARVVIACVQLQIAESIEAEQ